MANTKLALEAARGGQGLANERARGDGGLVVAGTCSPPFRELTPDEELATREMIEAARPHLLWVCLGSPRQERWCAEHVGVVDVPLMLAVGAAFDF